MLNSFFEKIFLKKKRSVRGQAALEFLASYGWALLVAIVALSNLAFFGVLSPGKIIPETCHLGPGLHCEENALYYFDSGAFPFYAPWDGSPVFALKIINGFGKDLSHMYIMVHPDETRCGGYYATLADPDLRPFFRAGESRYIQYITQDKVCNPSCPAGQVCFDGLCIAAPPSLPGAGPCDPHSPGYAGDLCPLGFLCDNISTSPYYNQCIIRQDPFAPILLVCGCPTFLDLDCASIPDFSETNNCCLSNHAQNVTGNPGGFCPGYVGSASTGANPPGEVCADMVDIRGEDQLELRVRIFYQFTDSTFMHQRDGSIRLRNDGIFVPFDGNA